jgi:hypothetical protein
MFFISMVDVPFGKRPFRIHIDPRTGRCGDRQRSRRSCSCGDVPQHRSVGPAGPCCVFALIPDLVEMSSLETVSTGIFICLKLGQSFLVDASSPSHSSWLPGPCTPCAPAPSGWCSRLSVCFPKGRSVAAAVVQESLNTSGQQPQVISFSWPL